MISSILRALALTLMLALTAEAAEIHDAVRKGDTATVDRLLKKDHDLVNLSDDDTGTTPLLVAVDEGILKW